MKTFYLYENKRKRYTATYSAAEQILYTVEYRVKKMTIMGKSIYEWREVASVRSMKKFQDIKHFIDAKVSDDMQMKSLSRRVYTNPFLEYVNHDNNIPSAIDWVNS